MKILITFALDREFAPWRRVRLFAQGEETAFAVYRSSFGETEIEVVLTGVGGVRARNVVRTALELRPNVCIAAGLAGGLRAEHYVGQVLAARQIVELDSGRAVAADLSLLERAESCGATIIERLVTSPTMIASAEGKGRLGNMGGAVEMESFAVGSEAVERGIRSIAIRAISDEVNEDLPIDFSSALDEAGGVNASKVLGAVIRAPYKLPGLVRLGRQSRAASAKLAQFLERYVSALAAASGQPAEMTEAHRT